MNDLSTNIVVCPDSGIPTFQSWRSVPKDLATKGQWLRRGRKVRGKEQPKARWALTRVEDPANPFFALAGTPVLYADEDYALLIDREIPLYNTEQTEEANFQPRTLAYMAYEEIFFDLARKDSYLRWDFDKPSSRPGRLGDWVTVTANTLADRYWQKGLLSTAQIRRHINQREIIGVKATETTRWIAIDHDFHGRDRQVYLDQAEVLLEVFHGCDTWHHQVHRDEIDGMHYILTAQQPHDLDRVTGDLRGVLERLNQKHSELARRAKAAGMRTLGQLEIYPHPEHGFRLPLSRGYQMLLDRPLPLVTWRKRTVQDVIAYIDWLNDPNRQHMSKEKILGLLWSNLGASCRAALSKPTRSAKRVALPSGPAPDPDVSQGLGSLKNCCRRKITGFWNGTFNPVNSLNPVLEVTARIFCFEGVPQEQAVELLGSYVWGIPDPARHCSDRLAKGNVRAIKKDIMRAVNAAYDGNGRQQDVAKSTRKLAKSVQCWESAGFRLSDKATWGTCWCGFSQVPDIEWTGQDRRDIDLWLPPAIGEEHRSIAVDVAQGVVKIVAVKHAQENGMTYQYWQGFLEDEYGIACRNRNKMSKILQAAKDLELIEVYSRPIWFTDGRTGMATIYRPGKRVSSRLSSLANARCGQGRALRPTQVSLNPRGDQEVESMEGSVAMETSENLLYGDL